MDQADPGTGAPVLDPTQARLLGCLIEKEATTPDSYPLTVNAAQAAANQKTAREPVMALDPGEVQHALRQLERAGLARQHFGSRAERYAHRATEAFGLTRQQTALLGLLLLRGPQTLHELMARSERMARFEGLEDARHHLERLAAREAPLLVQLPRAPGQREERYMHLLCGPVDAAALVERAAADRVQGAGDGGLAGRVEALEEEVAALRARLERLERDASAR